MQARYIQRGESIDFVPERDIAAGEIVIRNGLIGVARIPVKKGTLGSLALSGVFSAVTSGELLLGLAAESSKLNDSHVRVILNSGGITINNNEATLNWQTIN